MQCEGHRGNGETFTADVWFSTYKEGANPKLAAIIADATEEAAPAASTSAPFNNDEQIALNRPGVGGPPAPGSGLGEQGDSH